MGIILKYNLRKWCVGVWNGFMCLKIGPLACTTMNPELHKLGMYYWRRLLASQRGLHCGPFFTVLPLMLQVALTHHSWRQKSGEMFDYIGQMVCLLRCLTILGKWFVWWHVWLYWANGLTGEMFDYTGQMVFLVRCLTILGKLFVWWDVLLYWANGFRRSELQCLDIQGQAEDEDKTASHWRWSHYNTSKRLELFADRHKTSQKTRIFRILKLPTILM